MIKKEPDVEQLVEVEKEEVDVEEEDCEANNMSVSVLVDEDEEEQQPSKQQIPDNDGWLFIILFLWQDIKAVRRTFHCSKFLISRIVILPSTQLST